MAKWLKVRDIVRLGQVNSVYRHQILASSKFWSLLAHELLDIRIDPKICRKMLKFLWCAQQQQTSTNDPQINLVLSAPCFPALYLLLETHSTTPNFPILNWVDSIVWGHVSSTFEFPARFVFSQENRKFLFVRRAQFNLRGVARYDDTTGELVSTVNNGCHHSLLENPISIADLACCRRFYACSKCHAQACIRKQPMGCALVPIYFCHACRTFFTQHTHSCDYRRHE